jgi:hypothetical protein
MGISLLLILPSRFFPTFMGIVRSLFQLATDHPASLVGLDGGFVRGLAGLTGRGICVAVPLCFGFTRATSIYGQEEDR